MLNLKVGSVISFYPKTMIAIVKLISPISTFDTLEFRDDTTLLVTQKPEYLQKGFTKVESAGSGDVIGLKVEGILPINAQVYKKTN